MLLTFIIDRDHNPQTGIAHISTNRNSAKSIPPPTIIFQLIKMGIIIGMAHTRRLIMEV